MRIMSIINYYYYGYLMVWMYLIMLILMNVIFI